MAKANGRRFYRWTASGVAWVAAAVVVVACGVDSTTRGPSHGATAPTPTYHDADLARFKEFRQSFGLRSDDEWIQLVIADPESDRSTFGVPLTVEETEELVQRSASVDDLLPKVVAYGEAHPEDWAGSYIDNERGGVLVAQFTDHLLQHRISILNAVNPIARIEVREVHWTLLELREHAERLASEGDFIASLPAVLLGYGPDVVKNRVEIEISSADPRASERILDHLGWTSDLAIVESDGTGVELLPQGALRVTAVDPRGASVSGLTCVLDADVPGASPPQTPQVVTGQDGVCELAVLATGYWVFLRSESNSVVGVGRATVVADQTAYLTITVGPKP